MQPLIRSLLELDDINRQRGILVKQRLHREGVLKNALAVVEKLQAAAAAAQAEVARNDALTRQYTADVARCDATIEKLRAQQMEAATNKAYLACINGVEGARTEKKLRQDSLTQLATKIAEQQKKADEAQAKVADAELKIGQIRTAIAAKTQADEAEANLNALYDKQRAQCDEKALAIYERLVKSNHPRPLMKVDPVSRATPMGNCISTNSMEMLRMGQLVLDQNSNAILYIDEPAVAAGQKLERQEQLPTSTEADAPVPMPGTAGQ